MLRKDLLMRQFEEFGKVLAVIIGFKREKDWAKFIKEIQETAKKFTSLEIDYVENLLPGEFDNEIINHPTLLPEQQKILADLLYEKMHFYISQADNLKCADLINKGLLLYQKFSENLTHNEFNLDVHYKIEYLIKLKNDGLFNI